MITAAIGLDAHIADRIKEKMGQRIKENSFIAYDGIPEAYSLNGQLYLAHPYMMDMWKKPHNVIFYSYWDGEADDLLKSMAFAHITTFPDVCKTLPLNDKIYALIKARNIIYPHEFNHFKQGYIPAEVDVEFEQEMVLKWGNRHCGENKARTKKSIHSNSTTVEPFIKGESIRVLFVGNECWEIHYESDHEWIKNINPKVTYKKIELGPTNTDVQVQKLYYHALLIRQALELDVVGIDFIKNEGNYYFLEANAYPGFEDVPEAEEAFVNRAVYVLTHPTEF